MEIESVGTSHASVRAAHPGGGWPGCLPGGRKTTTRELVFGSRDDDFYMENWVFVDMTNPLVHIGVDLYERPRALHYAQNIA